MKPAALEDNHWMEDAIAAIVGIANSQDFLTADDLRAHLRPAPNPNWTGLAFTSAKRAGIIEPLGYQTSTSKTRRHGALRTWRRKEDGVTN